MALIIAGLCAQPPSPHMASRIDVCVDLTHVLMLSLSSCGDKQRRCVLLDNMCLLFPLLDWILDGPSWIYSLLFFIFCTKAADFFHRHTYTFVAGCGSPASPFLFSFQLNVCCSSPRPRSKALRLYFIEKCLQMRFSPPINPALWTLDSVYHRRRHPLASSTITVTAQNEWYHSWPPGLIAEDASQEDVAYKTLKKQLLK